MLTVACSLWRDSSRCAWSSSPGPATFVGSKPGARKAGFPLAGGFPPENTEPDRQPAYTSGAEFTQPTEHPDEAGDDRQG